jgi:hypothetical protein
MPIFIAGHDMTDNRIGMAAVSMLCMLAALGLVPVVLELPLVVELPNEGWNAIHAMHAFDPSLYIDPRDGIINNYPPLWAYLTGALFIAFGDPIVPGRIVGLAAFAATVAAVFTLARGLGSTRIASLLAASWLAATFTSFFSVGSSEPQMLASACVVSAAAMIVQSGSPRIIAGAALLMLLGGGFKHSVIALPLAIGAWLSIYRWPLFRVWLVVAVCGCGAAMAALMSGYGMNIITNLTVPRVLSLVRLGTNLALSFKAIVPLAAFGWLLARAPWPLEPALGFVALALAGGFLEILLFGGALGVSMNIAWDLMIASAVAFAVVWDRAGAQAPGWAPRLRLALVLAVSARLVPGFPVDGLRLVLDRHARSQFYDQTADLVELRDRLRALSGPVACEHLSICAWAGHASRIDLWKLRFERTLHPIVDTEQVLSEIARGQFAAVTLFGRHEGPANDGNLPGLTATLNACCDAPVYFGMSTLYLRRADPRRHSE